MEEKGHRPRKPIEDETQRRIREQWRRASAKYYRDKKEKILEKGRKKEATE